MTDLLPAIDRWFYGRDRTGALRYMLGLFTVCYIVQLVLSGILLWLNPGTHFEKVFFDHWVIQLGGGFFIPLIGGLHYKLIVVDKIASHSAWNSHYVGCNINDHGWMDSLFQIMCVGLCASTAVVLIVFQHHTFREYNNSIHYINHHVTFVGIYYYIIFFCLFSYYTSSLLYNLAISVIRPLQRRKFTLVLDPFDPTNNAGLGRIARLLNCIFLLFVTIGCYLCVNSFSMYDVKGTIVPLVVGGDRFIYSGVLLAAALMISIPTVYFHYKIGQAKRSILNSIRNRYFQTETSCTDLKDIDGIERARFLYERVETINPWAINLKQKWFLSIILAISANIISREGAVKALYWAFGLIP